MNTYQINRLNILKFKNNIVESDIETRTSNAFDHFTYTVIPGR